MMYPTGPWRGFWQQDGFGRQAMEQFELTFANGVIRGRGTDIIGPFVFRGQCTDGGRVHLVKQYVARHAVIYHGEPDGEGSIMGIWQIENDVFGVLYKGPFLMQPVKQVKVESLPIEEIATDKNRKR